MEKPMIFLRTLYLCCSIFAISIHAQDLHESMDSTSASANLADSSVATSDSISLTQALSSSSSQLQSSSSSPKVAAFKAASSENPDEAPDIKTDYSTGIVTALVANAITKKYTALWFDVFAELNTTGFSGDVFRLNYLFQEGWLLTGGLTALVDDEIGMGGFQIGGGMRIWQMGSFSQDAVLHLFLTFLPPFEGSLSEDTYEDYDLIVSGPVGYLSTTVGWNFRGIFGIGVDARLLFGGFEYQTITYDWDMDSGENVETRTNHSVSPESYFQLGVYMSVGLPLYGESGKKYAGAGSYLGWRNPENVKIRSSVANASKE